MDKKINIQNLVWIVSLLTLFGFVFRFKRIVSIGMGILTVGKIFDKNKSSINPKNSIREIESELKNAKPDRFGTLNMKPNEENVIYSNQSF